MRKKQAKWRRRMRRQLVRGFERRGKLAGPGRRLRVSPSERRYLQRLESDSHE